MNKLYLSRLILAASLHNETPLPKTVRPNVVSLKLTERCNSRCITCDYWRSRHVDQIETRRATKLLVELRGIGVSNLRLTGGEVLLREDLFDILGTQLQSSFSRVTLATNGLLLDKFSDRINDSIITNISVSIDGLKDVNDAIRGVPGYFDTAFAGIRKIRGKKIKIVSTITSKIIPDLEDLILLCRHSGYEFDINILSSDLPFLSKKLGHLMPSRSDVDKAFNILGKYGTTNGFYANRLMKYLELNEFPTRHCILGYYELVILPSGDVTTGCYRYKPVGNIIESSLTDIVSSPKYLKSAKNAFKLACSKCVCGCQISLAFEHPLRSLYYVKRRLAK